MSDEFINRAVRCPVCQTAFTHDQPVPPALSGRDSDLRPVFAGRDPLPAQVLTCPTCRYSAYPDGFEDEGELGDEERLLLAESGEGAPRAAMELPDDDEVAELRRFVKRPEYEEGLPEAPEPFGAARYILAARCHEFLREDDPDGTLDLYLRASWCARLTHEAEVERRCQREVVVRLRKRLDEKNEKKKLPDAERPRAIYLVAELSRRQGDFAAALNGFEELRGAVDSEEESGAIWLERARRLAAMSSAKSAVNAPWMIGEPEDSDE